MPSGNLSGEEIIQRRLFSFPCKFTVHTAVQAAEAPVIHTVVPVMHGKMLIHYFFLLEDYE